MTITPWRLDKSVSLGDLIVFLLLACSGIGYVLSQDRRQTTTEVQVEDLRRGTEARQIDLQDRMDRIEGKLDRLIEKGGR